MANYKLLKELLCLVAFCGTCAVADSSTKRSDLLPSDHCGSTLEDRVIGQQTAEIDQFRWTALLEYQKDNETKLLCEGALISKKYILTAAHCVTGDYIPKRWKLHSVRLGEHNLLQETDCDVAYEDDCLPPTISVDIEEKIAHELYSSDDLSQRHDIALLRLQKDIVFDTYLNPICLPKNEDISRIDFSDFGLLASGWGTSDYQVQYPNALRTGVKYESNEDCASLYESKEIRIDGSQLCTTFRSKKDKCKIADGGTLMSVNVRNGYFYAAGVMSFPRVPCDGEQELANVYTRVADYVPWIISKLKP